ncbi:non-canonical purine NTP pyrophosphatase [Enterococcus pseudoavium]|uniref:Non-canonical purine NTP pyrophosphatase n=1 Tax=Enterococcus pseudoavium TaxID=44007 RepID=A0ABU3FJR8_9ENTE|nr:non-canonical purine NTP pyrophosphatase [Enterococcus pseudoavium]MDT2753723.1 non-canonical purine NTP pyrophosphatase [Enterococcus pseudoavium]MDT2771306.1 non-canonical purine NTP pyrophosphatase [Enterococcus pseudoavium]
MKIIVGTNNQGKLTEMQDSIQSDQVRLISYTEYTKLRLDFAETGKNFRENAVEKAENFCHSLNQPVLADDGGLVLAAFPQLLGIKTARFFKTGFSDQEKNQQLFDLMKDQTNRKVTLSATLAYANPKGLTLVVEKALSGELTLEEIGTEGYGFDRIFFIPSIGKTLAQLPLEERNRYSPRTRALRELTNQIVLEANENEKD